MHSDTAFDDHVRNQLLKLANDFSYFAKSQKSIGNILAEANARLQQIKHWKSRRWSMGRPLHSNDEHFLRTQSFLFVFENNWEDSVDWHVVEDLNSVQSSFRQVGFSMANVLIGEHEKQIRELLSKGWKQREIAQLIGCHEGSLSRWIVQKRSEWNDGKASD